MPIPVWLLTLKEAAGWAVFAYRISQFISRLLPGRRLRSDYTFIEANITLSFPTDISTAYLVKEYKIVANRPNLRQMIHKNIAADGPIEDIRWNDQPVLQEQITTRLGEYIVRIDFPVPHKIGAPFTGKLSYICKDSFSRNPEGLVYCVDFDTKVARIRVNFPPDKKCISARASRTLGAGEEDIDDPYVPPDGTYLELQLERPEIAREHNIYWYW